MKEPHRKGAANHPDPESCASRRKATGEALTGAHAGWVWSSEISIVQGADVVRVGGRLHRDRRTLKSIRGPAESETPRMQGNSKRENRETPATPVAGRGRAGWRRP